MLKLWQTEGLTPTRILSYVRDLQQAFLQHIDTLNDPRVNRDTLLAHDLERHGHFFTFRWGNAEQVTELAAHLRERGVATDFRNDRLRFGFALYHNAEDYQQIEFD